MRNTIQIIGVAGGDLLTISPELLQKLADGSAPVSRKLSPEGARDSDLQKLALDEKAFRFLLNEDAMATEKLAAGIRPFRRDSVRREGMVAAL